MESSTSAGARRTMALLWRHRGASRRTPGRGRPPRITVEQIITAAIEVADTDGMAALSMGRVAERVGVAAMSLYTHVAGKAELIELMVDAVMRERALPCPAERPAGWREQVVLYARRTRVTHRRHPWLREVSPVWAPLGPGTMAQQEYLLGALEGCGLPPREMFAAADAVDTHVRAVAREEAEYAHTDEGAGQSWETWWKERQHVWEEYFDAEEYPTMARAWVEGDFEATDETELVDSYDYGLERLLDGIEERVRRSSAN